MQPKTKSHLKSLLADFPPVMVAYAIEKISQLLDYDGSDDGSVSDFEEQIQNWTKQDCYGFHISFPCGCLQPIEYYYIYQNRVYCNFCGTRQEQLANARLQAGIDPLDEWLVSEQEALDGDPDLI